MPPAFHSILASGFHGRAPRRETQDGSSGFPFDPEELYDLLMFIGSPGRFSIKHVFSRDTGEIACVSSTDRLSLIAGQYVGMDAPVFEEARRQAMKAAEYMRRHGPFEPHRVPLDEMEYTTLPQLQKRLRERWSAVEDGRQPEMAAAGPGQGQLGAEDLD